METLLIHTFKKSFEPIVELVNKHELKYKMREVRSGMMVASATTIELISSAAMWGTLATVLVAFIKAQYGRKIIITTKNNETIHAEGLTAKELEKILQQAKSITAIDPTKTDCNEEVT
jgi:hypothetical protein